MAQTTLFVKRSGETPVAVREELFANEQQLEEYICQNSSILSDVFIIRRQVRANKGADIPDIVAVDNDGNVVLIELKNVIVDEQIISQVLRYAIWAETNPDSIKSLWLECKDRPENLEIDWGNNQVRIMVVAPQIKRTVAAFATKIGYEVDLLEVKRLVQDQSEYILVNRIEPDVKQQGPTKPTAGQEEYNRAFYEREYNTQSVSFFFTVVKECEQMIKAKKWGLDTKFNKYYCGFKYGFPLVFSVRWLGSKSLALAFKLGREQAEEIQGDLKMHNYDDGWSEAQYRLDAQNFDLKKYVPLMEAAYHKITGRH